MREHEGKVPYPLLVVDDRLDVLQALTRFFELDFEHVLSAQNPKEAEELLRIRQPTFLLCDYWLGEKHPPSTEFLPRWREQFPCLKSVVLMTGTRSSSVPPCSAVDDIFTKPLRLASVVTYFKERARAFKDVAHR